MLQDLLKTGEKYAIDVISAHGIRVTVEVSTRFALCPRSRKQQFITTLSCPHDLTSSA
jgi:hypothetical protein